MKIDAVYTLVYSLERAKAVVTLRIETGHHAATLPDVGIPISEAIADFMEFTTQGGAKESTMAKYQTLRVRSKPAQHGGVFGGSQGVLYPLIWTE